MSGEPNAPEIDSQRVELLPTRVLLSLIGDGGHIGAWGIGGDGTAGSDVRSVGGFVVGQDGTAGADGTGAPGSVGS